jgi:hypothetical protein
MAISNRILSVFLFVCCLFSCSKDDDISLTDESLIGRWNVTESYADPGDGSGKWRVVSKNDPVTYVEFKSDGHVGGNAFPNFVSYVLKDSVTISFTDKNKATQSFPIQLKGRKLSMNYLGCIEGCGLRFEKVD